MNLKKIVYLGLILLVSISMQTILLYGQEDNEYESATEYDYPPFSVVTHGQADGFSVDLLKAVANEVGIKINFKVDAWNMIKKELEIGKLDVLPLVGYSEERDEYFDFTVPYMVLRENIFIRDDNTLIKSESDLKGKAIIVMKGGNSEEYALSRNITNNLIVVTTYTEAFKLLSEGNHDAIIAQGLVGEKLISELGLGNVSALNYYEDNIQTDLKVNLTGSEQKFCFAVQEGNSELLVLLNEGLAIVSANGTYDELYRKWFPFINNDKPSMYDIIKYTLILLAPIVIVLSLITIRSIKKQVKLQTEELTMSSLQLSFERNKYFYTLVSIGEGVIVINHKGAIDVINPVALQMLKLEKKDVIGRNYKAVIEFTDSQNEASKVDPIEEILISRKTFHSYDDALVLKAMDRLIFVDVKVSLIENDIDDNYDIVMVLNDVTRLKNQINEIKYLSFHDSLTNLYNRRFFEEEMKRLDSKRKCPITIVVADINGLKLINDSFGHLVGDEMIKMAASIIKNECRESDIVSRWGGDEFVAILPNTSSKRADELIASIKKSCIESSYEYGVLTLSFGHYSKTKEDESMIDVFKFAENNMYKEKAIESKGSHGEPIRIILNTLFEKNPRDKRHCDRVSQLGAELGEKLNLEKSVITDIRSIGLLHDIGKIIISQDILDKKEKLSAYEYDEIKKHPLIGYRILKTSNKFTHIADNILYHHERIDGKGYPNAIRGDMIPLESKIIFIVEAYDSMTAVQPYRIKVFTDMEAAIEIKKHSGTQFDKDIARVFVEKILGINWDELILS